MYTVDDIKEEFCNGENEIVAWWVFPDGFHANKGYFPTKEDALIIYKAIQENDL